jgi:translocation and assembly module TamA
MKNLISILLCVTLTIACSSSWAEITLQNRFIGINGDLLKNVQAQFDIKQLSVAKTLTVATVKRLYNEAPQDISKALQPYGYFKIKVTSQLAHVSKNWYANYRIDLGLPLRITQLDVKITGEAAKDPKFEELLAKFPLHQNDVFEAAKYNKAKQDLFSLAERRGYVAAKMQQSVIKIDLENYTAVIILHFASGPRYFFGPIAFSKTRFNKKFLDKFLAFKAGQYYSSGKLQNTQENFNNSDLFEHVTIETLPDKAKNLQVPIIVNVIPHKSKHYIFGLGYGTDTGVRGSLGLDLYNFNPWGHYFSSMVTASMQKQASFEVHYIIPGRNPIIDRYDIAAATQTEDDRLGYSNVIKLGPAYTTVIYGWQQSIRLNTQFENWKLKNQDNYNDSILFVPNITWSKRKANDPIRPTRGYSINVMTQGSVNNVISNISFGQIKIDVKSMYPILKSTILVLRGSLGFTTINDKYKDKLPLSFWFSAGGADSVRGYAFKSIGPGTELAVASSELRQKLFGNFYGAVFYDIGGVSNNLPSHYNQGIGIGLVWLSPVGAIRLSLAKPIDQSGKIRVQFSMGVEL